MINDSTELGSFLKKESLRLNLHIGHDTHYDAMNWELSWWQGKVLHRLDFQPLEDNSLTITHLREYFKYLTRFLHWCHRYIPMFPYLAHITWNRVSTNTFPIKEDDISICITHSLST